MKNLKAAMEAILIETIKGGFEEAQLTTITSGNRYVVSFPQQTVMGALVDTLEEYQPDSPWYSTNKNPENMAKVAQAAIATFHTEYQEQVDMMQVIDDSTVYLFYTGWERCIKITVLSPLDEAPEPTE